MGWTHSVVTEVGVKMLQRSLAGHCLTIGRVVGGSGLLDPDKLTAATDVVDWRQDLKLLGVEDCEGGKKIKIQITNDGVTDGFELHQVAVYARMDEDEEDRLLILMQDDRGVEVPAHADNQDFLFELYAVLGISGEADIKVSVDLSAVVSAGFLAESISLAVSDHNTSDKAHPDLRLLIAELTDQLAETKEELEKAARELEENLSKRSYVTLGSTPPAEGPALWFCTDPNWAPSEEDETSGTVVATAELGDPAEADEAPATAEINGIVYPATNTEVALEDGVVVATILGS